MGEVLLEDIGPNGNVQAIVEADEEVSFFYLYGAPGTDFGIRSLWVRNHSQAPKSNDGARMQDGLAPRNPAAYCRNPDGLPALKNEELRVVWLPEGDGAALYEASNLLAIIPPWSGINDFYGYAAECIGQGPLAWEIKTENVLIDRFREAEAYWRQWDDADFFPRVRDSLLSAIERALGSHTNYYAIDGGVWPPKALVRIPRADSIVLVTVGVSIRPQPAVELAAGGRAARTCAAN